MPILLEAKQLNIGYGNTEVVHNASFSVNSGEILCIAGESGSGKSTLLKAVLNLREMGVRPLGGELNYCGKDIFSLTQKELIALRGREIGAVFQNPDAAFNPIRKIEVQFFETLMSYGKRDKREYRKEILELFDALLLQDGERILKSYPFELSGGMKQRVAVALTMLPVPKLILADEPTSALDVTTQIQVVEELLRLRDIFGTSIVIVTHNLGIAAKMADWIAIMREGVILECDVTKVLLNMPRDEYTKTLIDSAPKPCACEYEEEIYEAPIILEVKDVSKTYKANGRRFEALKDTSFVLREGEILGIVGGSGSGKTTLARQIAGLERPSDGDVFLNGSNVSAMLSRDIQMVFQFPVQSFDPRMKIRTSIAEPLKKLMNMKSQAEINKTVDKLMEQVGLSCTLADRYPHELSGGQCQRAAIARAICVRPKVLICDEVTSSLDVTSQGKIVSMLRQLCETLNMAMVFISHDLALVSGLCHSVMIMKNGKCVERGRTNDVLNKTESPYTKQLMDAVLTIK